MVKVFRKIMLLTAFLIAIFIFLAGAYVGFVLDSYRVDDVGSSIYNTELDAESFVIENEFFDTFGIIDCNLLSRRTKMMGDDLGEIGRTLVRYDNKKLTHGEEYNSLRRKYFLLELKAYTLFKQMDQTCGVKRPNIILFFYDTKNNQESLNQGYVLDGLVGKRDDLVVLSLDKDFNDTAISSLVSYYNIT